MKIAATAVSMDAARSSRELEQQYITVASAPVGATGPRQGDEFGLRLSQMLSREIQTRVTSRSVVSRAGDIDPSPAAATSPGSEQVLGRWIQQLVGRPVTLTAFDQAAPPFTRPDRPSPPPPLSVRTAELVSCTVYQAEECLQYNAGGAVETQDGRRINFDFGLCLYRSTTLVTRSAVAAADLFIDPLVLRFDFDSPLLSDSSFLFDLDSDGDLESLACPGSGCGFLAFDRDGDGRIGSGLELFGPASGSGFGELGDLDSDGNRWIDENDPLFDQLCIWRPAGQGEDELTTLRQAGVGAISVLHAGGGFQLEGRDGAVLGRIKAQGIFLTEDGQVRSLAEVDLATETSGAGQRGSEAPEEREQVSAALAALRTIIRLQRFRLQMMLAGERLRLPMARRAGLLGPAGRSGPDWLRRGV